MTYTYTESQPGSAQKTVDEETVRAAIVQCTPNVNKEMRKLHKTGSLNLTFGIVYYAEQIS